MSCSVRAWEIHRASMPVLGFNRVAVVSLSFRPGTRHGQQLPRSDKNLEPDRKITL